MTNALRHVSRAMIACAAAALPLQGSAGATAKGGLPFVLEQVGPGIFAAIDGPDHKAGSNAGIIIGEDGVLVVDAFFNREAAAALVTQIHLLTTKPIRFLVNTHYHVDHTGGDQAFRDAGAVIIAHSNVRSWVRTENIHLLGQNITPELRKAIEALPLPDIATDNHLTVWLGSRRVEIRALPGHTGGDLVISVPDAKTIFAGDILWRKIAPNIIDGSVREWIDSADRLGKQADAARTIYIPGHGEVASADDVRDFRNYLILLEQLVRDARKSGLGADRSVHTIIARLRARHGDWTISDRAAAFEIHYMDEELAGTKRRPQPNPTYSHLANGWR